ncbi:MAG: MFS transporter [Candidatus Altiarchaeota archaeon]|nr:MFS transporter [Candidatus Altiarchaeota archaeon]
MRANSIFLLSTAAAAMGDLFIPLIALDIGASNLMTGVIVAAYGLMSLVSFTLFGWISDNRDRLSLIRGGLLLSGLVFILQLVAHDMLTLFLVRALCGFSVGVFYSSLVVYGLESKKKIGEYTSYESLGLGLGNLAAGMIAVYSNVFIAGAMLFLASFLMSLKLKNVKFHKPESRTNPLTVFRKNIKVYLPFIMRDIGAFGIWALFPIYLTTLGASSLWIGILLFLNTGSQFFLKNFVDRVEHKKLYNWGMILSAITFMSYVLPSNYLQMIPIQIMIAISWSCLQVGAIGILTTSNVEKATVIGLFSSARSFAKVIGPLMAGVITQYYGFHALMLFAGGLTLAGFALRKLLD